MLALSSLTKNEESVKDLYLACGQSGLSSFLITTTTIMKTDSKNDIVASLSVMDEVQMFKVLDFIRTVLAEYEAKSKKPSREQAMQEIQTALKDSLR